MMSLIIDEDFKPTEQLSDVAEEYDSDVGSSDSDEDGGSGDEKTKSKKDKKPAKKPKKVSEIEYEKQNKVFLGAHHACCLLLQW